MIRKISVQDIVSKRSEPAPGDHTRRERDYLIERLTRKHAVASIVESPVKTKKSPTQRKTTGSKKTHFGKKWLWLILPILIILFVVLQFMTGATITVKPKQATVQVDSRLTASLDATLASSTLMYQIITLSTTDSETVLATSTISTKPQKATGQISIFNNYSAAPQILIKSTRFETSDGLIYRTPNTLTVPGYTIVNGKTVPGSITVTVIADQTGSKYNIDMVDFTIPGFKTDAGRYVKIFARSKTAMTGGSDGNSFGVSEGTRQAAQADIEAHLQNSLLSQAQSQKTADSIIFDTASKISFQHLPDTAGSDAQHAVIHEQGTISSVAFDKKMLGKVLLSDAIAAVGNNAGIQGLDKLHFIAAVSSTSPIWQARPFVFTLTGPVEVTGVVNTDSLLQDIVGIPRSNFTKVLLNYPTIDKATATVRPFWKTSFPTDASKIKIEIVK